MVKMEIDISALRDDDDLDAQVTQFSSTTMDIKAVCFKAGTPPAQSLATKTTMTSPTHEHRMPGRSPLRTRSTSTQRRSQRGSTRRRRRDRVGSDVEEEGEERERGFGPDPSLKFRAEPSLTSLTPEAALGIKVGKHKTIEAASNGSSVAQASSLRASVASYSECSQGGNHKFHAWVTPRHAQCSKCNQKMGKRSELFGCEFCQIDLCQTCYSGIVPVMPVSSFLSADSGGTTMSEATSEVPEMGKSRTAKQCQLCGEVFRGFGDMCSICRKNPQGISKKCSVCHNYFVGHASMCEDCADNQMAVG